MLDSKQLAERAAIAILNGRRVLVAVPEAERSRVYVGRGLELQPLAEEDRLPSDAALQWGRLIGSHLLPKLPEEWAVQGDLDVLDCVGGLGVRMRVRQRGQILSDYYVCVLKQGVDINEPDEGMSRMFADELIAQAAVLAQEVMQSLERATA